MQTYQVKTGDTLISIARQWMGQGDAWRLIAQLNGLGDPSQLKVGQTLKIPITEYTVQSGDSLRRIALKELGTEAGWQNIAILNNITDPRFLVIGQVLKLPVPITAGSLDSSGSNTSNPNSSSNSNPSGQTLGSGSPLTLGPISIPETSGMPESISGNERSYTVQRGDSLITIAQKTLGDRSRWREIALRNNIANPADLRVNTILKLPPLNGTAPIAVKATTVPPTSPKPAASPTTPAQTATSWNYSVVQGDTLIGIARKTLGNGNRWPEIAELNKLSSPSDLRVGMVLRIPGNKPSKVTVAPAPAPAPSKPPAPQPEATPPSQPQRSYTVQRGDTLISIARSTLGNGDRWREIALLNNIIDSQNLKVGMVLKIPATSSPTQPSPNPPAKPTPTPQPAKPQPTKPQPTAPQYDRYTVKSGDTLISIARTTLGDQSRWQEIAQLNNIVDTRDLKVGMVLKIPRKTSSPAPTQPPATPTPPVTKPPVTKPPVTKPPLPPAPSSYTVVKGDTLTAIARKTLGDSNRWQEIADLNKITNPNQLRVGMVLKIPAQSTGSPAPTPAKPKPPATSPAPTPTPVPTPAPTPAPKPDSEISTGPSTYIVQAGDTLYSIADQKLGDRSRWAEIGRINNLPDPGALKVGSQLLLPGKNGDPGAQPIAPVLNEGQSKAETKLQPVKFTTRQDNVFAQWIKVDREENVGVLYEKGLYRRGNESPRDFIRSAGSLLRHLHLSDSEMNAIAAISDNEGYLDAVNTWDSQYLSFGLFQWTAGSVERPGELGALLTRLKQTYPDEFEYYFGQFGLDVTESDGVRAWVTIYGIKLNSEYQKSLLRQPIWAYRFAIAGRDLAVKSIEIVHAVGRIDSFYFIHHSALNGYSLADLIKSEFGVTLLLDNHVNRPAYVVPGLAEALKQLNLSPQDLASGSTETELRVLNRYLTVRETYGSSPMTHAKTRGDRISRQAREGKLSQERGSFVSNKNQRVG